MMKVFFCVVVSVAVLVSSVFVPGVPVRADSGEAQVVIVGIQAGGVGAATQELIVLYNNTPDSVDVTGWCLTNKSNAKIACFTPPTAGQTLHLAGYGYATIASESFVSVHPDTLFSRTYVPSNNSSGSITGSSDTISLLDRNSEVRDYHFWPTALSAGMQLVRSLSDDPLLYVDTDVSSDWTVMTASQPFESDIEIHESLTDVCPNIEDNQPILPLGMAIDVIGECIPERITYLYITEILPNAAGSDAGAEFIELYNPNDTPVALSAYQLQVGPQFDAVYDFPEGSVIGAGGYAVFSNTTIPYSLLNSSSRVRLVLQDGRVISEVPAYENPKDNQSWANIDGVWIYTKTPTPGAVNVGELISSPEPVVVEEVSSLKPCAPNQYRSPETNRCRLIATAADEPAPCKPGQYRNEETNRCRNIVAETGPAPCKPGQERNPDTNRCRNTIKMPDTEYAVLGAQSESSTNGYVWIAVGGVFLLALGYAIWEWHDEIGKFVRKGRSWALQFVRTRK
jgi:hypothetical protein